MTNDSTAVSNVIPFSFGAQEVRTVLVDDQPWFVAADVSAALLYAEAKDMTRNLDDDEKGRQIVPTLGGAQEMLVINESGLYSAILRSRKAEAKRFKKWVTAEVLPAIRKRGRYEDERGQMQPLMQAMIGQQGAQALSNVIRCRVAKMDAKHQRSAGAKLHSALHARFDIPRIELIPGDQMEAACNFVASYAIEGEYIEASRTDGIHLDRFETHHLYVLMSAFSALRGKRDGMLAAARALSSKPLMAIFDQIQHGGGSFAELDKRGDEIYEAYRSFGCEGGYRWVGAAA